jgi:hypothetical protein
VHLEESLGRTGENVLWHVAHPGLVQAVKRCDLGIGKRLPSAKFATSVERSRGSAPIKNSFDDGA